MPCGLLYARSVASGASQSLVQPPITLHEENRRLHSGAVYDRVSIRSQFGSGATESASHVLRRSNGIQDGIRLGQLSRGGTGHGFGRYRQYTPRGRGGFRETHRAARCVCRRRGLYSGCSMPFVPVSVPARGILSVGARECGKQPAAIARRCRDFAHLRNAWLRPQPIGRTSGRVAVSRLANEAREPVGITGSHALVALVCRCPTNCVCEFRC